MQHAFSHGTGSGFPSKKEFALLDSIVYTRHSALLPNLIRASTRCKLARRALMVPLRFLGKRSEQQAV